MLKKKRQGITLVALVVTIIVLLILVGITIGAIFGGDGTLSKAHETKVVSRASTIKDRLTVKHSGDKVKRKVGDKIESLDDFITNLKTEGLILDGEEVENYKLTLGTETIDFLGPNPYVYINEGDIVYYDPTKDANPSKLTYTSPKGSSKAAGNTNNVSGNGYGNQVFQATSSDNKWVVLSNKNDIITLMSADAKQTTSNENFYMEGATGYIYAEQELHKICSIYGHGKGASNKIIYPKPIRIGSPDDINGEGFSQSVVAPVSGARSLTKKDIEEVTGIKTVAQKDAAMYYFRQLDISSEPGWYDTYFKGYFNTNNRPNNTIRIPTLSGYTMGKPIYTYYDFYKDDPQISSQMSDALKDSIFISTWLASRCVYSNKLYSYFRVDHVNSAYYVHAKNTCSGEEDSIGSNSTSAPVRPVVQLQSKIELIPYTVDGYKWKVNQD